jgi:fatty acid desaturase
VVRENYLVVQEALDALEVTPSSAFRGERLDFLQRKALLAFALVAAGVCLIAVGLTAPMLKLLVIFMIVGAFLLVVGAMELEEWQKLTNIINRRMKRIKREKAKRYQQGEGRAGRA